MQKQNTFRLIERISSLLRSEQRKQYAALGLQPVHIQVLEFLAKCNSHSNTPAAVSEYLGITKGTISQSLQVLERKGYIRKKTDSEDGRVVHLLLQESGEKLLAELQPLDVFNQTENLMAKQSFSSLDEALRSTLKTLQKANNSKSFGLCHSCVHFAEMDNHYYCQLTDSALAQSEVNKICRRHC